MLGDLDQETKYLESIDNGEENLEIRLENLKKNDWKRMNALGENDNRLGLVHMGFECSLHDIYNPKFSEKGSQTIKNGQNISEWREEELWESENEEMMFDSKKSFKRRKSLECIKITPNNKLKRKWRFSVGDKKEYQKVKENQKDVNPKLKELYQDVKQRFSDFYDIEFIDQVWNMRDMTGNENYLKTPDRTPSPNKYITYSSNSKFNMSRTYSNTDSLTIKLSCINNPKSEIGSEWNESLMGILDDFSESALIKMKKTKERITQHKLNSKEFEELKNIDFNFQRRSHPQLPKIEKINDMKNEKDLSPENGNKINKYSDNKKSSTNLKKRFRKRKGISGTNSLSEMTGMFEDDLSNFMANLETEIPIFRNAEKRNLTPNPKKKIEKTDEINNQEENPGLFNLTTQTSKNWDPEHKTFPTLNGMTIATKSIDDQEFKAFKSPTSKEKKIIKSPQILKITNISDQIMNIAKNKTLLNMNENKDRLSHREMALSTERGLNFLIENWKELGTLQNPPNTLDQFSDRKDIQNVDSKIQELGGILNNFKMDQFIEKDNQKMDPLLSRLNPERLMSDCFVKKGIINSSVTDDPLLDLSNKNKSMYQSKVKLSKNSSTIKNIRSNKKEKKIPTEKSTPQNGKKVHVPQLKYPFSNFYLPNSKKIFAKSTANFSKTHKISSGMGNLFPGTPKTISDKFILENNPPKSHRQFSNKKRLRNDAIKKQLKINSKKKNSKELQKILELKKNLGTSKKIENKIEESLRKHKNKKLDSKFFQSDRNLSVHKSKLKFVK